MGEVLAGNRTVQFTMLNARRAADLLLPLGSAVETVEQHFPDSSPISGVPVFRAHLPVSFLRAAPDVSSGDAQYPPCLLEQLGIDRARL